MYMILLLIRGASKCLTLIALCTHVGTHLCVCMFYDKSVKLGVKLLWTVAYILMLANICVTLDELYTSIHVRNALFDSFMLHISDM